jgi:hypothetical protein
MSEDKTLIESDDRWAPYPHVKEGSADRTPLPYQVWIFSVYDKQWYLEYEHNRRNRAETSYKTLCVDIKHDEEWTAACLYKTATDALVKKTW